MELENYLNPPRFWNRFYYTVIHGVNPGIYWDWDSCMEAVGHKNYYEGRGKWRKLANLEQSLQLLQFAKIVRETDFAERQENEIVRPTTVTMQHSQEMQNTINAATQELTGLREERERCTQLMEQIRGQLDSALQKITRLETASQSQQQQTPAPPRSSMYRVMENLRGKEVGALPGCQFVNNDYAAVYTRGKLFHNPLGPEQGNEAAGFGIWFSDSSAWNVSSAWLEEYPLSKNNLEIVAAIVAMEIAAALGQRKLCIFTRSNFVIDRVAANWNTEGESNELLEQLRVAVESMEHVDWVLATAQEDGIQKAKQLAVRGATAT